MGGDGLAAADRVHTFVGFSLDADGVTVDADGGGEARSHLVDRIFDLWTLEYDGEIHIDDLVAGLAQHAHGIGEQRQAVRLLPFRIAVGEVPSNVAQTGRAENGVRRR